MGRFGDNNESKWTNTALEQTVCAGKKIESSWAGAENIFREVGARAKNIKLDYVVEDLKYHRGTD